MIRPDESNINGDGDDGRPPFDLIDLPQNQIDTDWEQFSKRHIDPHRLFQLSVGMIEPTMEDRRHLEYCDRCGNVFHEYRCAEAALVEDDTEHECRTTPARKRKLDRGRVVLDILLLLDAWSKPTSITVLEPALVLMRNEAARKTLMAVNKTPREKATLRSEAHFITGLEIVYQAMIANGAIRRVGENGYELANPDLLKQVSDADRSKAQEVVQAIETLSDLRSLPEILSRITNERYTVTV